MSEYTLQLADQDATEALGATLALALQGGGVVYLHGDLGAGKTTLVRGLLHQLGHRGAVKSPTYTLVEPYQMGPLRIYHFDLYRLGDPEELELMGGRDYFEPGTLSLIEWPEQGTGYLPMADLGLQLRYAQQGRSVHLQAHSPLGEQALTYITTQGVTKALSPEEL